MSTMEPIEQMPKMSAQERRAYKRMQEHVAALNSENDDVAQHAKRTLIRYYGSRSLEMLIDACNSENPCVRYHALWILGKTRDERAFETLLRLTRDIDGRVRYDAALALGNLGDHRAIGPLVELMCLHDSEECVDDAAAGALGMIGAAAVPALSALVDSHDDPWALTLAAGAMRMMRDERTIETLETILTRSEDSVRIAAIEALGAIGTDRSRAILAGLMSDASEMVRRMARIYLESTPEDIFGRGA